MVTRVAWLVLFCSGAAFTCDCVAVPANVASRGADIVFQGKITRFRRTASGERVVVEVSRVWKGRVTKEFEMPAHGPDCQTFQFQSSSTLWEGNELLVFASKAPWDPHDYAPLPCNTLLLKYAAGAIQKLGHRRPPVAR